MENRRTTRWLCLADPRGDDAAITRAVEASGDRGVEAIAVVGDLAGPGAQAAEYRSVFHALGRSGIPAYWVPGSADAPIRDYLHESYNIEIVFPLLHGVHGTAAIAPGGHVLVCGMGGAVDDDPDGAREEVRELRYPRWEAEYRLKIVREFGEHELVLLCWTPPAHKGHGAAGSEALAVLVNTHRPRLVVCAGPRFSEVLGNSHVVAPGSLSEGCWAVADLHSRETQMETLGAAAR